MHRKLRYRDGNTANLCVCFSQNISWFCTHLSGREGHLLRVVVQQPPEVYEEALGSLGAEETDLGALRADRRLVEFPTERTTTKKEEERKRGRQTKNEKRTNKKKKKRDKKK